MRIIDFGPQIAQQVAAFDSIGLSVAALLTNVEDERQLPATATRRPHRPP